MNARYRNRIATLACLLTLAGCVIISPPKKDNDTFYQQRNLVADQAGAAENLDRNLVNAWGIAFNPFGVVWVNDNGSGKATLYDGDGRPQALVVTIPGAAPGAIGNPTGIVFYGGPGFIVRKGMLMGASR